jgi:4-hydroxy-tetrahydrodipicolinate synthase
MNNTLKGTGVALITPFTESGAIDFDAMANIINYLIEGNVNYIVALGTTAESVTLSKSEKKEIAAFIQQTVNGRIPLVLGIGGNNTAEIIESFSDTDFKGYSAILSVSPYYNKPSQEGIYQHYAAIAKLAPLPIILYNVPGRTASNMNASTTLRLAHDFPNIIGIKEASGNMEQSMRIIQNKPTDFLVISGDDALTLPFISIGMEGVISVAAHANPLQFSKMVDLALKGNITEAAKIHYSLLDMMCLIFEEGNPAGIKSLLSHKGLCKNVLRLPLCPVSNTLAQKLSSI